MVAPSRCINTKLNTEMHLHTIALFLFLCSSSLCFGQTIERSVVNAFGSTSVVGDVVFEASAGEAVVTGYAGNFYGQQGFIQAQSWTFVSIDEPVEETLDIIAYPNPATDNITLQSESDEVVEVQVFDLLGNLKYKRASVQLQHLALDVRDYASGIYFVRITVNGNQVQTLRFEKL